VKIRHLTKTAEFRDILKTGRKIKGEKISVHVKLFSEQGDFSVGIIIPKKVVPLATKRNYIRRIIYGFFLSKEKSVLGKRKIVIRVTNMEKKNKRKETLNGINQELNDLLERIKIFR